MRVLKPHTFTSPPTLVGSQELSPASGLAFISLPWPLCAVAVTRGPVFGLRMESQGAAALDRQASSRYFAALDSSVGDLRQRAQSLIDRLNDSRKEDHTVMSSFRDSLQLKVRAVLGGGGGGSVRLMRLIALFQPNYPWCRGAVRGGAAGKQPPAAEPGACLHRLRQRGAPRPLRGGCSCLQLCFREQKGRRRPPVPVPVPTLLPPVLVWPRASLDFAPAGNPRSQGMAPADGGRGGGLPNVCAPPGRRWRLGRGSCGWGGLCARWLQQPRAQLAATPAKPGREPRQRWAAAAASPPPPPPGTAPAVPTVLPALLSPTSRLFFPFPEGVQPGRAAGGAALPALQSSQRTDPRKAAGAGRGDGASPAGRGRAAAGLPHRGGSLQGPVPAARNVSTAPSPQRALRPRREPPDPSVGSTGCSPPPPPNPAGIPSTLGRLLL